MKINIFLQVYMLHLDKPVNVIAKPIDQYDKKNLSVHYVFGKNLDAPLWYKIE